MKKFVSKQYVLQNGTSTDKLGHIHQKCGCTLPLKMVKDMDLFHDDAEDRTVLVEYDEANKIITIKKVKKA